MAKNKTATPEVEPAVEPVVEPTPEVVEEPAVEPTTESTAPVSEPTPEVEPAAEPTVKKYRVHCRPATYAELVVEATSKAEARQLYLSQLGIWSPAVEPTITEEV